MMLSVLITLAAALTAAASTKVAGSALEAYLVKNPATINVLLKYLRRRVRTAEDAEDLVSHTMAIAIRRERTGKGRRWVEGGDVTPIVHLRRIAWMLLRMSWEKGKNVQSLPLDEPDLLESEDPNVEEVAVAIDEQDERAAFLRQLRELCEGETNAHITIGILDNASIRSHPELARILKCEPKDVKLGYDRLMRRADRVRLQRGTPS